MKKNSLLASVLVLALLCGIACVQVLAAGSDVSASTENDQAAISAETAEVSETTDSGTRKNESVYIIANADGSVRKILVSDQFENCTPELIQKNLAGLGNVQNVKGDDCWQGESTKELPVEIAISYTLDGKEITPDELAGKSGHVTIRFDYINKQYETKEIDGSNEKIYVPFTVLTGLIVNDDCFSNIELSNAKLINDGDKTIIAGAAFPGLQESLGIDRDTLDIPDYVEIRADVESFELETTVTLVTNSYFENAETDKDKISGRLEDKYGDMLDKLSELDMDGMSSDLDKLQDAMSQLMSGSNELYNGLCSLANGCGDLSDGADKLAEGLAELDSNSEKLNDGAKQVFETLLSAANTQIQAAGLDVPELTVDNYGEVLNDVINTLSSAGAYAQEAATDSVEAAVRSQTPRVRSEVNRVVEKQVTEKVTAAARQAVWGQVLASQGLTEDSYEAAVSAGYISKEQQQALQTACDQAMEADSTKAMISQNVNEQMQSDSVQNIISANTEEQIQILIDSNMDTDHVQNQISSAVSQAAAGAESLRALKTQLDSYAVFYNGLKEYTGGVAEAADGAAKLQGSMPELMSGVNELRDGSKELNDGLESFNRDGIEKLVSSLRELCGEVENMDDIGGIDKLADRIQALIDVSRDYRSYTEISGGVDSSVKFVFRTEAVEMK